MVCFRKGQKTTDANHVSYVENHSVTKFFTMGNVKLYRDGCTEVTAGINSCIMITSKWKWYLLVPEF